MATPKKIVTFLQSYRSQVKLITFVSLLPLIMILKTILEGSIPFWHNPARDMVRATQNLQDVTLLGPTTGVQGVFYGPHTIWAHSLAILISPDPRVDILLTQVLPYLLLIPLSLYAMRKLFPGKMWLGLWFFMALTLRNYISQPWHPHIVPTVLVTLAALLILPSTPNLMIAGFISGLAVNIHFAVGLVVLIASGLYILIRNGKPNLKAVRETLTFGISALVAFTPNLLFEVRNNFLQSRSLLNMFFASYTGGEVELQRLSKPIIVKMFFETLAAYFKMPLFITGLIFILMVYSVFRIVRTQKLEPVEKRLLTWIGSIALVMVLLYLGGKTPVWMYHFIGIQVFVTLILGWLALKSRKWQISIWIWIIFVAIAQSISLVKSLWMKPLELEGLAGKEYVVDHVFEDAKEEFGFAAYSSSIYSYDYDYLFNWKESVYGYEAKKDEHKSIVYVVIPPNTGEDIEADYVSYKTPDDLFTTLEVWESPNRTKVYKRMKVIGDSE